MTHSKFNATAGMYAWGGPGTVRLIQTKYPHPQLESDSFLSLYELSTLQQAKKVLKLSDVWVTYSWGFSDATEQQDYDFITSRLKNFKKLGLKTHAYVQGLNLVTEDFADKDVFCSDPYGRKIPYSKGRSLTCPNNPHFVKIITQRVAQAAAENFDGVFVDNIVFGLPPVFVQQNIAAFFGCYCQHCQLAFKKQSGFTLKKTWGSQSEIAEYVSFRKKSVVSLIQKLSKIAYQKNKFFGVNLFDPFNTDAGLYFGYELQEIKPYLDYFFIENHRLPSKHPLGNTHLPHTDRGMKPFVIISYNQGIGYETAYTQHDFDSIYTESQKVGYVPCYKVSEFTTDSIWHRADFSKLRTVKKIELKKKQVSTSVSENSDKSMPLLKNSHLMNIISYAIVPLMNLFFNHKFIFELSKPLHQKVLHKKG